MFAVIRAKNHQYRVNEGDVVAVNHIAADVGARFELTEVLMAGDEKGAEVGTPLLAHVKVTAEVLGQERSPKIVVFKFRRRKNYRRLRGHRQERTIVKIVSITKS